MLTVTYDDFSVQASKSCKMASRTTILILLPAMGYGLIISIVITLFWKMITTVGVFYLTVSTGCSKITFKTFTKITGKLNPG